MQPSTFPSKSPLYSWQVTGASLTFLGLVLLPTILWTMVGIGCIIVGVGILTAAFIRSSRHHH